MGVFARIMMGLAEQAPDDTTISIDATYRKAHPTASRLWLKRGGGCLIGQTRGGMNTKPHAVTEGNGRPVHFFITAGEVSDYACAAAVTNGQPEADWLLADRGYDADWFREGLIEWGTRPCIAGRKSPKTTIKYDKRRYKRRNRIERMFGNIKDWRRVATRYDRSPELVLSALVLATTIIFWYEPGV